MSLTTNIILDYYHNVLRTEKKDQGVVTESGQRLPAPPFPAATCTADKIYFVGNQVKP